VGRSVQDALGYGRRLLLNSLLKAVNSPLELFDGEAFALVEICPQEKFFTLPLNIKKAPRAIYARRTFLRI